MHSKTDSPDLPDFNEREFVPFREEPNFVQSYFRDLWAILTRPTWFFRKMPIEGGLGIPLTFALVTHWLGAALSFFWRLLIGGALSAYFSPLFKMAGDVADIDHPGRAAQWLEFQQRVVHWFWGAGAVIADPFLTLFAILFTSFFVFIGARILVSPGKNGAISHEITYESAVRIICYGMSPAILAAIPLFGSAIASICVIIVTVIGARETYRIGTGRAITVALFPKLLFLGILLTGLMLFAVAAIKLLTTAF